MDTDVVKLIESKHEVTILGGLNEFVVMFYGPPDTAYEGNILNCYVLRTPGHCLRRLHS